MAPDVQPEITMSDRRVAAVRASGRKRRTHDVERI
jgi:hypothetical protein